MLSGGRLRLGLGVGWNPLEYEALGEDFSTRGKRMDEQIPLMQRLWTERRVSAEIGDERFSDVGLNPPAHPQHPDLAGRQGAGRGAPRGHHGLGPDPLGSHARGAEEAFVEVRDRLHAAADAAGRPREELGIEVWLDDEERRSRRLARRGREVGGTRRDAPQRRDL